MKKTWPYLTFLFLSFILCASCARKNTLLKNQDFTPSYENSTGLYKSILSEKSQFIISTGENDKGLMIYDLLNKKLTQLNDLKGAGSKFLIDQDEKNVVFMTYILKENRKFQSILIQNIKDKKIKSITGNKRILKLLSVYSNSVIYLDDDKVLWYDILSEKTEENPEKVTIAYSDNDLNLILFSNGEKKILNPLGSGNYIWVAISPNKKSVLYNKPGSGTYICDLKGNNTMDLGKINYAHWVGKGKWIVGMEDLDDGHKFTKSDIFLFNVKRKTKTNLTQNSGLIAMYPAVSENLDKLVFNDEKGRIFITAIKDHKTR